jgi:hypothetical protein
MELAERVLRERGTCLQCHALYRNAEYEVFAPSLFGVGLSDETLIRESIVDPNKVVPQYHRWVHVELDNGTTVSGKLISRSDQRLVLITRGEQNQPVPTEISLSAVQHEDGHPLIQSAIASPMPTGFDRLLSERELNAVITLIRQLN